MGWEEEFWGEEEKVIEISRHAFFKATYDILKEICALLGFQQEEEIDEFGLYVDLGESELRCWLDFCGTSLPLSLSPSLFPPSLFPFPFLPPSFPFPSSLPLPPSSLFPFRARLSSPATTDVRLHH